MEWNTPDNIIDSFQDWLTNEAVDVDDKGNAHGLGEDSIKSYCSYVKNAFEKVITLRNTDADLVNISQAYLNCDVSNRNALVNYIKQILKREKINPNSLVSPKTISNYTSGLSMFFVFLDNCIEEEETSTPQEKAEPLPYPEIPIKEDDRIYSNIEMLNKMMSKLKTEDRGKYTTAVISYPIRLICKIMSKCGKQYQDKLKQWMTELVLEMDILLSEDEKTCTFREVKSFIIKIDGSLYIKRNGIEKEERVFTRTPENKVIPFFSLNKKSVIDDGEISRDHKNPLKNKMSELCNDQKIPTLKDLTKRIDSMGYFERIPTGPSNSPKMKISIKKYSDNFLDMNPDVIKKEYAEKILEELNLVLPVGGTNHSLELMKKEYNTLKNAKII